MGEVVNDECLLVRHVEFVQIPSLHPVGAVQLNGRDKDQNIIRISSASPRMALLLFEHRRPRVQVFQTEERTFFLSDPCPD